MNKWFEGVFLPSIFRQCNVGAEKWLTQKQTAVCVQNMLRKTVRYDSDGYGTMYNHDNYFCVWDGREVTLSYSKKNSCGCIRFGMNRTEVEARQTERDRERERINAERVARIKRHPHRLEKLVSDLNARIADWKETYKMDLADGLEEDAKKDMETIKELESELALYI